MSFFLFFFFNFGNNLKNQSIHQIFNQASKFEKHLGYLLYFWSKIFSFSQLSSALSYIFVKNIIYAYRHKNTRRSKSKVFKISLKKF
jgi:hypothetical protein